MIQASEKSDFKPTAVHSAGRAVCKSASTTKTSALKKWRPPFADRGGRQFQTRPALGRNAPLRTVVARAKNGPSPSVRRGALSARARPASTASSGGQRIVKSGSSSAKYFYGSHDQISVGRVRNARSAVPSLPEYILLDHDARIAGHIGNKVLAGRIELGKDLQIAIVVLRGGRFADQFAIAAVGFDPFLFGVDGRELGACAIILAVSNSPQR